MTQRTSMIYGSIGKQAVGEIMYIKSEISSILHQQNTQGGSSLQGVESQIYLVSIADFRFCNCTGAYARYNDKHYWRLSGSVTDQTKGSIFIGPANMSYHWYTHGDPGEESLYVEVRFNPIFWTANNGLDSNISAQLDYLSKVVSPFVTLNNKQCPDFIPKGTEWTALGQVGNNLLVTNPSKSNFPATKSIWTASTRSISNFFASSRISYQGESFTGETSVYGMMTDAGNYFDIEYSFVFTPLLNLS